jgi:chromate transporter
MELGELWELFRTFLMIGFVSFGGGYAMMIPIGHQVNAHQWMTEQEFTDVIAVAGMSPGPIATNSAIFVGYKVSGFPGAISAAAGMVLPSLLIVLAVAAFFYKMNQNYWVKAAFYGLRAIITGLILYGAIRFGIRNGLIGSEISVYMVVSAVFFAAALIALLKFRVHPLYVILLSGLVGIAVYG